MATGIIDIIKRASMDANNASNPTSLKYGTVTNVNPLEITISSTFKLPTELLIVPEQLTDHTVEVTMNWGTTEYTHTHPIHDSFTGGGSADPDTHSHNVTGRKSITIHNALKVGDRVTLIREQGGRKYFVLDRF